MFQTIYRGFASLGWFHLTMAALIALVAGLLMFLSFALIAGQMLLALAEAYIGVGGGVLILGFSGSRWTIKFAEGFLGWITGVGVKLLFLYLLVGIGMVVTSAWNSALIGWTVGDPTLPLTIAGGSLIFMLLAWNIPNTAASIVGGSDSLNLSHAFETAMAAYGLARITSGQATAAPALTPDSNDTSLTNISMRANALPSQIALPGRQHSFRYQPAPVHRLPPRPRRPQSRSPHRPN